MTDTASKPQLESFKSIKPLVTDIIESAAVTLLHAQKSNNDAAFDRKLNSAALDVHELYMNHFSHPGDDS